MSRNLRDRYCWSFVSLTIICLIFLILITNGHCTIAAITSSIESTSSSSSSVDFDDTTQITTTSDLNNNNYTNSLNITDELVETTTERFLITNLNGTDETFSTTTTTENYNEKSLTTIDDDDNDDDEEKKETNIFPLYCQEPKNQLNAREICEISTGNCPKCSETDDIEIQNIVIFSHDTSIITFIHIHGVPIQSIPETVFEQYDNLAILQLEDCQINELDGITNATKLKKLYVNNNNIRQISEGQLYGAPNLRLLDATHNKIENVDERAFNNNANLYWLDLSNNRIGGLPWGVFQHLKAVVTINLAHNMIEELGLVCSGIETLSTVDLSFNRIKKIRFSTFERTTNLEVIHLGNNEIEMIEHNAFDQCSKLKSLDLSNNRLQSFHFDIPSSQFSNLLVFNNSIGELACTTRQQNLSNLKLHAQNNQISTLFVQEGVPITDCNLDNNKLKSLSTLTKIYTLTSLRLSNNDLSESDDIPSFANLQNLVELDMSYTNIQSQYIENLFQLKNLIFWLDLSGNPSVMDFKWDKFTECPLRNLKLNNCNLTDLNIENLMSTVPALHEIEIDENAFPCSTLRRVLVELSIRGISIKKKDMNDYDHIEGIYCINDTQIPQADEPSKDETSTLTSTFSSEANTTKLTLLKPIVTHISPIGTGIPVTEIFEPESDTSAVEPPPQIISTISEPTHSTSNNGNSKSRIQIKPHVPTSTTQTTLEQKRETTTSESDSNQSNSTDYESISTTTATNSN